MFLLAGLGNPGRQYARNRHNIGYKVVDAICHHHGLPPYQEKFAAKITKGRIGNTNILALKPQTYMNRSGEAISLAMRFYKLAPPSLIVIHDDIDLAFGLLRIKQGGGHAGHNGLRNIDAHIGREYIRLRVGIGHPGHKEAVNPYVLGDFTASQSAWLEPKLTSIAHHFPILIEGNPGLFLTRLTQTPAPAGQDTQSPDQTE